MLQDIEGAYIFSTPGPTGSFSGLKVTVEAPCPAPEQLGIAEGRVQATRSGRLKRNLGKGLSLSEPQLLPLENGWVGEWGLLPS